MIGVYPKKVAAVNKLVLLIPAALLLSACDKPSAPAAFTPEMASFSNEFEFDPLRGPVKDVYSDPVRRPGRDGETGARPGVGRRLF